jgi:hypothetical protein
MKKLLLLAMLASLLAPSASAKEFPPGDISACGATRCRAVAEAPALGRFLYGQRPVVRAPTAPVGAAVYQLRFREGPAGVIVTESAARVHGLNCGRFRRGVWYRLPRALHGLGTGLRPKRLRAHVPPSC